MNVVGRSVRIRLLPQAVEALSGIAQVRELTEAVVVDEDQLGIWISLPSLGDSKYGGLSPMGVLLDHGIGVRT
jgi:hypothetical protein